MLSFPRELTELSGLLAGLTESSSGKNKPVHERVSASLPFWVLETAEGKPLRIAGVAMVAGMSRNRNVYTPEEPEAFAPKLVGSLIYIEHVAVPNAIGKVTNCTFDAQTSILLSKKQLLTLRSMERSL